MTDPPRTPPAAGDGARDDSRAEQVLSQALRVMAGGGKAEAGPATDELHDAPAADAPAS